MTTTRLLGLSREDEMHVEDLDAAILQVAAFTSFEECGILKSKIHSHLSNRLDQSCEQENRVDCQSYILSSDVFCGLSKALMCQVWRSKD